MKKLLFTLLVMSCGYQLSAATDNRPQQIRITVKGLENQQMILANYYGDKQYVKDTLVMDKKGTAVIKADTMLPGGIYLAVFPALNNRYFEFVVSEPNFSLETDTLDMAMHMKITNSLENKIFYDDMKYLAGKKKEADSLTTALRSSGGAEKEKIRKRLDDLNTEVKTRREELTVKQPNLLYPKIVRSMKEVDIPDFPRDAQGKVLDSTYQWQFYKKHYWDYFDLTDERLLRCPVLNNKYRFFFDKLVVNQPDSIITAMEDLLQKTDFKNDIYRFILTDKFNEAANSKIMGMDAVYVHLGKKYFGNENFSPWMDSVKRFKIMDRVNRMEPLLIGKIARNITLADSTNKRYYSLYDQKNKYVILAFWDPDCGHCKKEIPVLHQGWKNLLQSGLDVGAYAPAIMEKEDMGKWTDFIRNNNLDWINVADPYRQNNFRYEWDLQSTPQIFVLDKDKRIVARRMSAEQVEDYIRHLDDPTYKPKTLFRVGDEEKQETAH